MADTQTLIKTVIQVLNDGSTGFADIGENMKSSELKSFFVTEAQTRAKFAQEVASAAGISAQDAGGTAAGAIHRTWGDLKAKLGGGDHTLLETAEQGEDASKKAYKEVLEDTSLPANVRSVLQTQQSHIQASHDKVKAFRDSGSNN